MVVWILVDLVFWMLLLVDTVAVSVAVLVRILPVCFAVEVVLVVHLVVEVVPVEGQ